MQVVANTLENRSEILGNGYRRTYFNETVRLPTYLITFAVGQFDIVKGPEVPPNDWRERPIPLRGVTIKGHGDNSQFVLQRASALLIALEQYFGVQYPFEKLDILLVPESSAGNMENAAIPTFTERGVAIDESAGLSEQRMVIRDLAHELAHQWFGNLVTMPWWNDVWLKESFATWVAPKIAGTAFPELHFNMATKMDAQAAMFDDARATQRSLRTEIEHDDDIEQQYGYNLIYEKGAGLLSMFENYIGAGSFQQGLRNYFARHAFGSASADDFMRAVGESTGNFDMPGSIATFMKQAGVPHLNIKDECRENRLHLHIAQSRYLILGSDPVSKTTWKIPFCVSSGEGDENKLCRVLDQENTDWELPLSCDASLMPNSRGAGYFYWSISQPMFERLLKRLPSMSAPEALDIANNISASLINGKIDVNVFLRYLPAMTKHWHPHVITRMQKDAAWILEYIATPEQRPVLMNYLRKHFGQRLHDIDLAPQEHYSLESYFLRSNVLPFVANYLRDERLLNQLVNASQQQWGKDWTHAEKPGFIAPELVQTTLSSIVIKHPREGTDALLKRLETEQNPYTRLYILDALSRSEDAYVVSRIRTLFDSDLLDRDEKSTLFQILFYNTKSGVHSDWLMSNFDRLQQLLPENQRQHLPLALARLCDSKDLARERAFFLDQHHLIAENNFDFQGGLEAARQCIALRGAQPPLNLESLREH
jgi:alanyl aminopeptidase